MIGQQVPTFARDAAGANPQARFSMDKWDGYTAARDRLYARLKETKAPNPIVLSGDVHMHYGADLKMDFRESAFGDDRRRVHEHVDHVRRRRRGCRRDWEQIRARQPAHQVSQRAARLHRLHRDARDDAGGLQGPGQGDGARSARHAPAARSSSKRAGRAASRTKMKTVLACALAIGYVTTGIQQGASPQTTAPITVTATPKAARPGDLVVLTIVTPAPVESVQVRAFDRDVPSIGINKTTFSVLVGIDLAVVPGSYRIAIRVRRNSHHVSVVGDGAQICDAHAQRRSRIRESAAECCTANRT